MQTLRSSLIDFFGKFCSLKYKSNIFTYSPNKDLF